MDALLSQDCGFSWEAIYVDNGSTDSSYQLIEQRIASDNLAHVHLVDGSQEKGQVYARNLGSRIAKADLLAFTDQDDLPAPTWVSAVVQALSSADAIGGFTVITPDGHLPPLDRNDSPPLDTFTYNWAGFDCAVGTNIGIHRHVLETLGGWRNLDVHAGEDTDLSVRLKLAGYHLAYAPEARVTWRARRAIRDIFNQAITYGRSEVLLYKIYREHGAQRHGLRKVMGTYKRTLFSICALLFKNSHSYHGIHTLGLSCGRIFESIRSRTIYL